MALTVQEMLQQVGMRPTLIIGLGGTGQKVLVQLKARFQRNYGQMPPVVELLCFDTDQNAEQTQVEGKVISLTAGTELINIGGIQTGSIVRNLNIYPAIAAWLSEDKEGVPTAAIQMGAKQVRPLGRLALFYHIGPVFDRLKGAVGRLTDIKQKVDKPGMNVFVISSVCGGTGSAIAVDMAYLVRKVIKEVGIDDDSCYINGLLALPSVFPTVDRVGIESNAYATLRELDYFMSTDKVTWDVDYGNSSVSRVAFTNQRPFTICYLVNARNEQGKGLPGLDEVAPMLAEAIYLQISSQVGNTNNSRFDNVQVLSGKTMDHEEVREKPTAYSSLGTASLIFPVFHIIDLCAHRLCRDLVAGHVLRTDHATERVDQALNGFLQANQLEADTLLQQIARDSKNNILRPTLDPRQLDRYNESQLLGAMQAYLGKAEGTVDNEWNQVLEINRKAMGDRLAAAVDAEIQRLVDDQTAGLYFTAGFLEKLDARLAAARNTMDRERQEMDGRRDRGQAQLRQTSEALTQALRSFPVGRGQKVKEARNRHIETFQSYLTARWESRKREVAIALLAALSATIQGKRTMLQRTIDRLRFIQSQISAFIERNGEGRPRTDFVLATDISDQTDIDRYYAEHFARLGASPAAALLDTQGPLHTWLGLEQEAIQDRLLVYTRSVFDDLKGNTIEQIILDKRDIVEPRRRLLDLINRSVPFWMYRRAGVLGADWAGEDKIVVIGVADRERSLFKDMTEQGQELVSTFDPHQVTVLQTKHGVPLFALTQYQGFKDRHDHVLQRGLKPLYVFPEVRPGGEKAKQVFALGLAYGFIFKSGVFYHLLPVDPGQQPIRLAQGMEESLRVFRNSDEWTVLVNRQVEEQISREGGDKTVQILEAYRSEPYVCELKGGAAKVNIDRAAMTRDTTVGKPGSVNYELIQEMRKAIADYIKKSVRG